MKRTVKEIHRTEKSNSSYGNWVTMVTVIAEYSCGHKRVYDDIVFTMKKAEALRIRKGLVLDNVEPF